MSRCPSQGIARYRDKLGSKYGTGYCICTVTTSANTRDQVKKMRQCHTMYVQANVRKNQNNVRAYENRVRVGPSATIRSSRWCPVGSSIRMSVLPRAALRLSSLRARVWEYLRRQPRFYRRCHPSTSQCKGCSLMDKSCMAFVIQLCFPRGRLRD